MLPQVVKLEMILDASFLDCGIVRFPDTSDWPTRVALRKKNKRALCILRAPLEQLKDSWVIVTFRRAAFVLPIGLKIVRSAKSKFSILIRKTSSGRRPVSRMICAMSFSGWLALAK